jgi:phosphoserine aminotransferase
MPLAYDRVFNFSAGPSTLPVPVLEQARDELLNYQGTGMSVMEMSHRSKPFEAIIQRAEADLRKLLGVPEGYRVLFLQGGASLQFSMLPMSFLRSGFATYAVTGSWGQKAVEAAKLVGETHVIFDAGDSNYDRVPDLAAIEEAGAEYIHFTSNETIQGVQFKSDPATKSPLVCDMSSDILSRPVDIGRYHFIYAGAQKNMGPAGVVVVIAREDWIAQGPGDLAPMLDYQVQAKNDSLYNTPPCWSIYICGLVYAYLLERGGLAEKAQSNQVKADILYRAVDDSGGFYKGHAQPGCRSTMNVTFTLPSDELTQSFVKEATAVGLDGLKGHRSVGGIRASIYNAFPQEGCEALAEFMERFARKNS